MVENQQDSPPVWPKEAYRPQSNNSNIMWTTSAAGSPYFSWGGPPYLNWGYPLPQLEGSPTSTGGPSTSAGWGGGWRVL